jgi:hypothetical protein
MRIDSSGNVLVGKTSNTFSASGFVANANGIGATRSGGAPVQINRTSSDGSIQEFYKDGSIVGSIGSQYRAAPGDSLYFVASDTGIIASPGEDAIIPATTNGATRDAAIDLGVSSGRFKNLYLSTNAYIGNAVTSSTDGSSDLKLEGNQHIFRKGVAGSYAERMRINSAGNLLWANTGGVSSSQSGITFNNTTHSYIQVSGGSDTDFRYRMEFINGNGTVGTITTNGLATAYNTSSDYRLKENVVTDWEATSRLKQLKPSRFNFITEPDRTVDGFLAHEVQDIVPEAIAGVKDEMQEEEYEVTPAVLDEDGNVVTEAVMGTREVPKYQGIDQAKLVPLLVKTIQELEARITALES